MVAFRKLFPVLAISAFLLGTASTASAQIGQPLVCQTNAGVPPLVRAEGFTELVGDIVIICNGGDPNAAMTANFQLFLNTNITSRLLGNGLTEALLLIDEPGVPRTNRSGGAGVPTPFCVSPDFQSNSAPAVAGGLSMVPGLTPGGLFGNGTAPAAPCTTVDATQTSQQGTYTVFRAQQAAGAQANNAAVWAGVPIVPPGTNNSRSFRITNIRANAAGAGVSTSLVPTQIIAFLSVSATQSLALNNPQQAVGLVIPGLQFDVTDCDATGAARSSFVQCVAEPRTSGSRIGSQFGLRFREGFQTAFKTQIDPAQNLSVPGVVYNTESGFVRTDIAELANVGTATSASRVAARFDNLPAGARIWVSVSNVLGNAEMGSATADAFLVSAGANGIGGSAISSSRNIGCDNLTGTSGAAEIAITAGSGVAVWEVSAANSANIDTLFFQMTVEYTPNTGGNLPGLGQASVAGSFAPFYAATSNANMASASLPIPRFLDSPINRDTFRIDQCVSNLLFPFVTNQAGFDTGIAISNTSMDPFAGAAARQQTGNCTINYYGTTPNGGAAPAAQTTTSEIEPGSQLLFVLSSPGTNGIGATPGFQGYIIATCAFQYAHGFAFITDGPIGQAQVAEGYLALVMDESFQTSRTGSISEVLGH